MVCLNSSLLIIENSVKNSTIYQNYLQSTGYVYNLSIVTSIAEGLDLCRTSTIDTVLLGGSISDRDGLTFLESLAAQSGVVGVASPVEHRPTVIMIATEGDPRIAVRAIKLGAQDYLLERDLTPALLQSAISGGSEQARLQLQLPECNDRFRIAIPQSGGYANDNVLDCTAIFSAIRDETGQIIDFRFDYLNPSALASNQMTAADTHRSLCEIFPAVRETGLFVQYCRVVETGEPLVQDNLIYSDTFGTQYLTRVYDLRIVKLDDGVIASWRDITDRKQAELALQASEERYKALIDVTTEIVWNAGTDGMELTSNWGTFTGQSLEEYQGWGWMEAIHPDDRQRTSEVWLLAVANLTLCEIEHRLRRWDGEYRLMSARAIPLLDADGSVREWVGLHTDITEARQDEQNLRRSEEFNRRILENNQDCIKVLDLEGRLLYLNDGGKRLLEIDDFANYDRSLWTQFWGGSEQELAQAAFATATAGTISKFEGRCPTVTGVPKWWEVNVIPLHDEDGNVEQILVISHDLTERRQAEDELRQTQALVQSQLVEIEAIYRTAPIGLTIFDVDLRYLRINQRLAESNGIAIADHIGRTLREIVPDLADEAEPLLRRVLETGEALLNLEISGETSAQPGIYRTWVQNYYPLKDRTGQSIGINAVVQEITQRKIAEAALLESEEQFRSTFEQAAVGIAHVALDGRWLLFNHRLCEICGYTRAELLDGYFQDITHPDDLTQERESNRQLLADEIQFINLDKRYIHKLGHIVWINLTASLRRDPSGAPLYFIASIEDISDRKHAEFALQAQAVKLAETTALVELRNQELNRFSHTVSHDLKAPLRGISNLAAWIRDDLPPTVDPDILANLELMRSRVTRMDSLIDGLLEYARVGSTAASLETFSVEQLLAEIVDSLSIPDSFVVELPAELPPITTHRVLLSQVLANLIGNAYKHHDRPNGRIQVTAQPEAEMWGFSVTDDGRGIAPANQERVFDIFKTLSGADKNNTGIGLSIVKKLVETHGGKITLESQLGMATTFNFTWIAEI